MKLQSNYDRAEALCNEGLELMMQQEWELAGDKFLLAVQEDPESPELRFNAGKCCFHLDQFNAAVMCLQKATELNPEYAEAWALLGSCYYAMGRPFAAQIYFANAMTWANDGFIKDCTTAYAHSILAEGRYELGFECYQDRLQTPDTWDGTQSLRGKTLLVKAEGGLGDQIFFSRYSEFLNTLGAGYVLWEVDAPLQNNLPDVSWIDTTVRGEEEPEHDYMVHAGSLPFIFGTKQGTIPVFHHDQYELPENITRVGLAWSGNPLQPNDHHRSISLALFQPLFDLEGVSFHQMQKDVRYTDKEAFEKSGIAQYKYDSVADLSMQMDSMSLIITVDTMTAHLAGSMGIPTWLLLPYAPDWRWGFEGDRTEWYPSIRIFRQGEDRKWEPVIERVVAELTGMREPHD